MPTLTLEQIDAKRADLIQEAQAITGAAVKEGRALTDDEKPQLDSLTEQIAGLDEQSKAQKADQELVARLNEGGGPAGKNGDSDHTWQGDIGDYVVKSPEYTDFAKRHKSIGQHRFNVSIETPFSLPQVKAPFLIGDNLGTGNDAYPPPRVEGPQGLRLRPVTVPDLFGVGAMEQTSLTYWQQLTATPAPGGTTDPDSGAPGWTAEGGQKHELTITGEMKTELLHKIAGYTKFSDETMDDAAAIASLIRSQLLNRLDISEENAVLNGPGGTNSITGILQRSGILTVGATADADGDNFNAILLGMTNVSTTAFFPVDALVIHPLDYFGARTGSDANGQYFGGGPFTGAYGNGGLMSNPGLWGVRTVVTPAIAQGTALVGAFGVGGQVFRKGGVRVETANQNEDDFIHDLVTVRAETRLLMAVYYPSAFCEVTLDGSWGNGSGS